LFSAGLWIGLLAGSALQAVFLIGYLARMDWKKVMVEVREKAYTLRCPTMLHVLKGACYFLNDSTSLLPGSDQS